jgi:Fe-S-cluster containining protein
MNVDATSYEVEVIYNYAIKNNIPIDESILEEQKELSLADRIFSPFRKCIFLDTDGACKIYPVRPFNCRKYFVVSDPKLCEATSLKDLERKDIQISIQFRNELIVSGILNAALLLNSLFAQSMPSDPGVSADEEASAAAAGLETITEAGVTPEAAAAALSAYPDQTFIAAAPPTYPDQTITAATPLGTTSDNRATVPENIAQQTLVPASATDSGTAAAGLASPGSTLPMGSPAQSGERVREGGDHSDGTTGSTGVESAFTDKLKQALRASAGEDTSGGSLEESAAGKSEAADQSLTEKGTDVAGPTYAHTTAKAAQDVTVDEKAAAVEKAIDRIIDDLSSVKAENSEIRITLEPEDLGVLTVSVMRTGAGITAKIRSDDKELCSLITDHIQRLMRSMEDSGVKLENVDVVFSQTGQNMSFAQDSPKGGGNWQRAASLFTVSDRGAEAADTTGFFDVWSGQSDAGGSGSTVEYRI